MIRARASWALIALALGGCPRTIAPPSDAEPALGRALALAELPRDPALAAPEDAGYVLATRSPAIDAARAAPLAVPTAAEALAAALDVAESPEAVLSALSAVAPGGDTPPPAALDDAPSPLPYPSEVLNSERGRALTAHLPEDFVTSLRRLVDAVERAHRAAVSWDHRGVPPTGPAMHAEEFFVDSRTARSRFLTHPTAVQMRFAEHARHLDYRAMERALSDLAGATLREGAVMQRAARSLPRTPGPLLRLETRLGPVIVGGRGPDRFAEDALLVVDPGGDDEWSANAGSNVGVPGRASVALDLGGNDRYHAERTHTQGAGFLGLGLLVDLGGGDDDYLALAHAQGAGFLGAGMLWDDGGDDTYQSATFSQGAGAFGLGVLVDAGNGRDRQVARARSQGYGATAGLGALVDLGGSDQRRLGIAGEPITGTSGGWGQGAGTGTRPFPWQRGLSLHGGVGLLYDRGGDDSYFATGLGQGAGWMLGLGLLLDRAGDDHYSAEQLGQGAAAHLAVGALLDAAGDDEYRGSELVQGAASDRAAGILWDRRGNDTYLVGPVGTRMSGSARGGQGMARQVGALGLLLDGGGDDHYEAEEAAQGFTERHPDGDRTPAGLLCDSGGRDRYYVHRGAVSAAGADGAVRLGASGAVAIDSDEAPPGWSDRALWPAGPFSLAVGSEPELAPAPAEPRGEAQLALAAAARGEPLAPETRDHLAEAGVDYGTAAARALTLAGDPRGPGELAAYLAAGGGGDAAEAWLQILSGGETQDEPTAWLRWWQQHGEDLDLTAALPALRALARAEMAASRGRPDELLEAARALRVADESSGLAQLRVAALCSAWATSLSHPESQLQEPALAVELAQLAVTWTPDQWQPFAALARAWGELGELDLARRALDKALYLDSDAPGLALIGATLADPEAP